MIKKIILTLILALPLISLAESIAIIVPFPAGGAYDIVARKFARFIDEGSNTTTITTNVLGAGGYIGIQKLATSPPNTLLITSSSFYSNLKSYNIPLENFEYVSVLASAPYFLIGSVKKDLTCEKLKNNQNIFFVGTAGKNSASSIPLYMIQEKYNNFKEVPYKGTVTAITDLLSGEIDLTLITGLFHNRPDVTIIANTSDSSFSDVPSFKKCLGINKTMTSDFIIVASKNSSVEFLNRINSLASKFTNDKQTREYFKENGLISKTENLEKTKKTIMNEFEKTNDILSDVKN